jgi:uncharacterized protein (TIGR02145 family)
MRQYLKKLKETPLYVKIVAITISVIVIALVIVMALNYREYYSCFASYMIGDNPWKSGGTVVTLSQDGTLRVRAKSGISVSYYDNRIVIEKKGEMKDYFNDGPYPFNIPPWSKSITRVIIEEGVTHIGSYAFYKRQDLKSVVIPNTVQTIGAAAFRECRDLISLTIPSSVRGIGSFAFDGCLNLIHPITIPNSVEFIDEWAFHGTVDIDVAIDNPKFSSVDGVLFNKDKTTLIQYPAYKKSTSYTIPDGVIVIGNESFNANMLRTVTIPSSVADIGRNAFSGVNSIIVLNPTPPKADGMAFSRLGCLYVPESSLSAYYSADVWRNFSCIKPIVIAHEPKKNNENKSERSGKRLSVPVYGPIDASYESMMIDGKRWMSKNLNTEITGSWCYENSFDSCAKYGGLYTWEAAKTVCPTGWHLPSHDEWYKLFESVGGEMLTNFDGCSGCWSRVGKKLKSTSGWYNNGNDTDDFGFSAVPGGYRYDSDGAFAYTGYYGVWWMATEKK